MGTLTIGGGGSTGQIVEHHGQSRSHGSDQPTAFNPDGNQAATNVLTVNSGGLLNLNMGVGSDDSLGGLVRLLGGTLNVSTATDTWVIDGDIEVPAGTGISQLSGEALTMTNASTTIGAGSTLRIAAPLTIGPGATFSGTGVLAFNNPVNVSSDTTLNMVGGTVDLDGTDAVGDQINIQAHLVINAATMESFGPHERRRRRERHCR